MQVVGGATAFKFLDPLSDIATYPPGALRRAGASSGRAIAIAGRDARRGRRGAIYAEDRDGSLKSRALDGGRLSLGVLEFSQVSALLCIFTDARPRPQALVFEERRKWALPGAVARGVQIKIKRTVTAGFTQEEHQEYGTQRDPRPPLRRDQARPED